MSPRIPRIALVDGTTATGPGNRHRRVRVTPLTDQRHGTDRHNG
jgi:hypothetical protein